MWSSFSNPVTIKLNDIVNKKIKLPIRNEKETIIVDQPMISLTFAPATK